MPFFSGLFPFLSEHGRKFLRATEEGENMKNRAGKGKDNVMSGERMRPLRGLSTFGQRRRKASLSRLAQGSGRQTGGASSRRKAGRFPVVSQSSRFRQRPGEARVERHAGLAPCVPTFLVRRAAGKTACPYGRTRAERGFLRLRAGGGSFFPRQVLCCRLNKKSRKGCADGVMPSGLMLQKKSVRRQWKDVLPEVSGERRFSD